MLLTKTMEDQSDIESLSTLTESVHSRTIFKESKPPCTDDQQKDKSFSINWFLLKFKNPETNESFIRFISSQQSSSSYLFSILIPYFLILVLFNSSYFMNGILRKFSTRYPAAFFMVLLYFNFFLSIYTFFCIRSLDRSQNQFIYLDSDPYIRPPKTELEPIAEGNEFCQFTSDTPSNSDVLSDNVMKIFRKPKSITQEEQTDHFLRQHMYIRRLSILFYYLLALIMNANLYLRTFYPLNCGIGCWLGVPVLPTMMTWIGPYMWAMGLSLEWEIIFPVEMLSLLSYIGATTIHSSFHDFTPLTINLLFSMVAFYLGLWVMKRTIHQRMLIIYQQRERMAQFIAHENWKLMEQRTNDFFWGF